jgi:hypothetical protein
MKRGFMPIPKHEPGQVKTRKPKQPTQPTAPVAQPAAKPRQRTGGASDYGKFYWCVKTDLSDSGEIYVYADEVRYTPVGSVSFVSKRTDGCEITNLALAPGSWTAVFAASCFDGHAVAVEHWEGEVAR